MSKASKDETQLLHQPGLSAFYDGSRSRVAVVYARRAGKTAAAEALRKAQERIPHANKKYRLERDLENDAVRYAHRERGFMSRKMNGLGFRAWPDRLFIWPQTEMQRKLKLPARQEYVEFKLPGEEPTPLQLKIHRMLRAMGCKVHVIDNWVDFYAVLGS